MSQASTNVMDKVNKIREAYISTVSVLFSVAPFVASLLMKLRVVYDPVNDKSMPIGTNGTEIIIRDAFMDFTQEQQVFALAHEALHLGLRHIDRCSDKIPTICNIAADAVVNDTLIQTGFKPPGNIITAETIESLTGVSRDKIMKMNLEEIYSLLARRANMPMGGINMFPAMDITPQEQSSNTQPINTNNTENKEQGKQGTGKQAREETQGSEEQSQGTCNTGIEAVGSQQAQGRGGQDTSSEKKGKGRIGSGREEVENEQDNAQGGGQASIEKSRMEVGKSETGNERYVINEGSNEIYGAGSEEEVKRRIVDAVFKSYVFAKTAGTVPGHIEGELTALSKSVINWRSLLRRALVSNMGSVYETWVKPNRRFDDYPGVKRFSIRKVWVLIDTSGSISDEEFSQFMGEVYEIARLYNAKVNIIEWDADIERIVMDVDKKYIPKLKRVGYGGTVITPALEYAIKNVKLNDTVIIFSDWELSDYEEAGQLIAKLATRARLIMVTTYREPPAKPPASIIIKIQPTLTSATV